MNRNDLSVYFIMGTQNCVDRPLDVLEEALKAGITFFQLREKGEGALKGQELEQFALACQMLCKHYRVPFIVNDNVKLALKINADGVHVGQDDSVLEKIRSKFEGKIIGVSVHTKEELDRAVAGFADYVGIGPIYETNSKPDAKKPAGVTFLHEARVMYPGFPIVAIGGITEQTVPEVRQAGADGVAVISAICHSTDRNKTIQALLNK